MNIQTKPTSPTWKTNNRLLADYILGLPIGEHNLMVAMGAGKSSAFKIVAKETDKKVLLVAPNRTTRQEFEEEGFKYINNNDFLTVDNSKEFMYPANILASLRDLADSKGFSIVDEPRIVCELAALHYTTLPAYIFIDEADGSELNAIMDSAEIYVKTSKYTKKDWSNLWNTFLSVMAQYAVVVKVSATPSKVVGGKDHVIPMGTTVRVPKIFNHLLRKHTISEESQYVGTLIKEEPTIVFANRFKQDYYTLMQDLQDKGKKVLLLTRSELLDITVNEESLAPEYTHSNYKFNQLSIGSDLDITKPTLLVVENIDKNFALDTLFDSFDVIFITQSHSRVVSVHSKGRFDKATVITIGSTTAPHVQAMGRFRDVPVTVHNIINSKEITKENVKDFEGEVAMKTLLLFSPNQYEYVTESITAVWVGTQGKSVSASTVAKRDGLDNYLANLNNGTKPKYKAYVGYCTANSIEMYQYNQFSRLVK